MRWLVAVALMMTPAAAADCQVGSGDVLKLDNWEIADDQQTVDVAYSNSTDRDISIAQGGIFFFDPLGGSIGFAAFDPDTDIPAGGMVNATAKAVGLGRTKNMKTSEVKAIICLTGAVYADGTSETFSAPAGSLADEVSKLLK